MIEGTAYRDMAEEMRAIAEIEEDREQANLIRKIADDYDILGATVDRIEASRARLSALAHGRRFAE